MAFETNKIGINKDLSPFYLDVSGNINIDGSIFQYGAEFIGGGGGGDVQWSGGSVGSNNQLITSVGDGSINSESNLLFNGLTLELYVDGSLSVTNNLNVVGSISGSNLSGTNTGDNAGVTSIATSAPLSGGTITSTGTISISQATTSTNGYLSSTDWNTFNNKTSNTGTVTSVAAGNGLNFTTITGSGSAVLGTPGTTTSATANAVTSTSHTHALGSIDAADITAGTLGVARGGTGATTFTSNGILTGNTTSAIQSESTLTYNGTTFTITRSSTATTAMIHLDQNDSSGDAAIRFDANPDNGIMGLDGNDGQKFKIYGQDTLGTSDQYVGYCYNFNTGTPLIGIAKNSPTTTLDVGGNTNIDGTLTVNAINMDGAIDMDGFSINDTQSIFFQTESAYKILFTADADTGYYWTNTGGARVLNLRDDGTNRFRFFIDTGRFEAYNDVVAYYTGMSDKRLKTNIELIEKSDALSKVLSLQGIKYDRKDRKDDRHLGYIAQDVEKIIPEVVTENEVMEREGEGLFKGIRYSEIIPYVTEAIKEQQKIISSQQSEINELREKLNTISKKLNI